MKFSGADNETIFAGMVSQYRRYMFDSDLKSGLSIIWNTGKPCKITVNNEPVKLGKNCIVFLTEYHQAEIGEFECFNVIQFNREFYCIDENHSEVGCKGVLFFGAESTAKITIPDEQLHYFNTLWQIIEMEMDESDALKAEMLKLMLKRFMILSVRIYKNEHKVLPGDHLSMGIIREFNYLVEVHFKTLTRVSDYAALLHRSPKTLANIFAKYIDKTPLQIINERRLLEAQKLLANTDLSIQQIADQLSFSDVQSFSQFVKTRLQMSPTQYRKSKAEQSVS